MSSESFNNTYQAPYSQSIAYDHSSARLLSVPEWPAVAQQCSYFSTLQGQPMLSVHYMQPRFLQGIPTYKAASELRLPPPWAYTYVGDHGQTTHLTGMRAVSYLKTTKGVPTELTCNSSSSQLPADPLLSLSLLALTSTTTRPHHIADTLTSAQRALSVHVNYIQVQMPRTTRPLPCPRYRLPNAWSRQAQSCPPHSCQHKVTTEGRQ